MQQVVEKFLAGLMSVIFGYVFFSLALFTLFSNTSFTVLKNKDSISSNTDIDFIILVLLVFVSILLVNILVGTFYYLFDKSRYPHPEKTAFAIIIGSLAIEALIVPMFFIYGSVSMMNFYFVMILQIVFPIIFSQLIIESLSKDKNSLAFTSTLMISTMMSILILLSLIVFMGYPVLFVAPILILPLISIGVGISSLFVSHPKQAEKKILIPVIKKNEVEV
jgi:hypothetical protein